MKRAPTPRPTWPTVLSAAPALVALLLLAVPPLPLSGQGTDKNVVFEPALFHDLDYRMVGPSRGGRVTTVAGHPDRPLTFYMGSTGGGVWKSADYGHTWRNVSDGYFGTASMGALAVAPSDPDVVYAGTGSDGIRSNVVTGRGAYRSVDGGKSWEFLGLREAGQIGAVEVDPRDPDRVYVAALGHPFGTNAQRGVFRSLDGGATWERVLFVSDSVGVVDLELNPADPDEIYAAAWRGERKPWTIISGCDGPRCGDGIWKSTDEGDSWRRLETGLPGGLIGKADLAVTPADPDRIYALVEAPPGEEGLYRSDDRGETWRLVNDRAGLMTRPFYFTNVTVHPTDPDVLYVGNVRAYKSSDGGETFERWRTPHPDNHALWISPERPAVMIQGNDGGANVSLDGGETWTTQANQPTAELYQVDVDDRFPYWLYAGQQDNSTIAVPSLPPAESAPGGPAAHWEAVGGCETGPAVPKPGDATVVYANCKGRFGRFSRLTGQEKSYWVGAQYMYGRNPAALEYRFQRTVPIEVSPHDPSVVYHASQYVHRTTDEGVTWERISPDLTARPPERQVVSGGPITRDITGEEHYSTLYAVEVSPHDRRVIWAGSNDGLLHVTRDGGERWRDVTPEDLPPLARINAIDPSPHAPGAAYVTAYRFQLDDWEPYVYATSDWGESWSRITTGENGIPADHPVRVVREDPDRRGLLYAGTEFGMFVSFDDGGHWQPFQLDLPVTPITDIAVHRKDLVLSTMGRSFWILDDLTPLHQLDADVAASELHLFRPRDAHRIRYDRPGGFGPPAPHAPEYPPRGAIIDYWLGSEPAGEVRLEILDAEGDVVRAFTAPADAGEEGAGAHEPGPAEEEEGEEEEDAAAEMGEPGEAERAARREEPQTARPERPGWRELSRERGMHRFVWDLRHPGADVPEEYEGGAYGSPDDDGPLAVPGEYRVRLTADGESRTRPLRVRIDPRVAEDGVARDDLEEQLALNMEIRDAMSAAVATALRIGDALERLGAEREAGRIGGDRARELREELEELRGRLVTPGGMSYPPPMLIDQLDYLYGMTTEADQELGRDAFARYEELAGRLEEVRSRMETALAELPGGSS